MKKNYFYITLVFVGIGLIAFLPNDLFGLVCIIWGVLGDVLQNLQIHKVTNITTEKVEIIK